MDGITAPAEPIMPSFWPAETVGFSAACVAMCSMCMYGTFVAGDDFNEVHAAAGELADDGAGESRFHLADRRAVFTRSRPWCQPALAPRRPLWSTP